FAAGGAILLGAAAMAIAIPALGDATRAPSATARDALSSLAPLAFDVACTAALILAAWAALDLVATRAAWRARLKMTPVERRQEERDLYGDPALRRARADARREVTPPPAWPQRASPCHTSARSS